MLLKRVGSEEGVGPGVSIIAELKVVAEVEVVAELEANEQTEAGAEANQWKIQFL